jgi:hypothetical protein
MEKTITIIVAVIVLWALTSNYLNKKRREALFAKYGDYEIVNMIMKKMFWQGQRGSSSNGTENLGKPPHSISGSAVAGSRRGRRCPRATSSGKLKI